MLIAGPRYGRPLSAGADLLVYRKERQRLLLGERGEVVLDLLVLYGAFGAGLRVGRQARQLDRRCLVPPRGPEDVRDLVAFLVLPDDVLLGERVAEHRQGLLRGPLPDLEDPLPKARLPGGVVLGLSSEVLFYGRAPDHLSLGVECPGSLDPSEPLGPSLKLPYIRCTSIVQSRGFQ